MTKIKALPELLAPAGSPESFEAAIKAGADAVYFGATMFNARMNAHNFTRENIKYYVDLAHDAGVRTNVTLNTAITDRQMKDAMGLPEFLYKTGVEALIVADLGLAGQIRKYFPDFELHASTQASAHNLDAVRYLADLGFSRVVVARELPKADLEYICKNANVEIEAFVHGALCVSASGQCLFSSLVGGRSGNRGECAQPCRLPYNNSYPLSLKDNCLAGHVKDLIDMGCASLKIEGRMKSPDYVKSVISTYRALLDENRNATRDEISQMAKVFSRSGFTDGYYTGRLGESMLGVRTQGDKIESQARVKVKNYENKKEKIKVKGRENALPVPYKAPVLPRYTPKKTVTARFYDPRSIDADVARQIDIAYLPLEAFSKIPFERLPKTCEYGLLMPPVIFDSEMDKVRSQLKIAKELGVSHALVGNAGHISLAKEFGFTLHGDYRLNVFNCATAALHSEIFKDVMLAPELTLPQIRDISCEKSVIVYGKVPLMTIENRTNQGILKDRRAVSFPVKTEGGREIVFNAIPFYMGDKNADLEKAGIFNRHFIFVNEGPRECAFVLENYRKNLPTRKEFRRFCT